MDFIFCSKQLGEIHPSEVVCVSASFHPKVQAAWGPILPPEPTFMIIKPLSAERTGGRLGEEEGIEILRIYKRVKAGTVRPESQQIPSARFVTAGARVFPIQLQNPALFVASGSSQKGRSRGLSQSGPSTGPVPGHTHGHLVPLVCDGAVFPVAPLLPPRVGPAARSPEAGASADAERGFQLSPPHPR